MDVRAEYEILIQDIKKLKENMRHNSTTENVAAIQVLLQRCDNLCPYSKDKFDLMMLDVEALSMITELLASADLQMA